ncbi:MAG: ECF transporter S component [Acutalibacteraceae bacterium]
MSKTTNKARMQKTVRLVELALLTAIIAVMTFTPIGYLKLGPLELTLIMVPVIIGAVTLGPAAGAFFGARFWCIELYSMLFSERIRCDTYFYKRI